MNTLLVSTAIILVAASGAGGQTPYKRDIPDSLARQAKVSETVAAATAQRRVPKGKIEGVELERENGKLMFSYDIKTSGKSGIDEVNVDAITGKIIGFAHESAATEKKEAEAEARGSKKIAPKKP
jgi:uncharacterized membrane protein YkoI